MHPPITGMIQLPDGNGKCRMLFVTSELNVDDDQITERFFVVQPPDDAWDHNRLLPAIYHVLHSEIKRTERYVSMIPSTLRGPSSDLNQNAASSSSSNRNQTIIMMAPPNIQNLASSSNQTTMGSAPFDFLVYLHYEGNFHPVIKISTETKTFMLEQAVIDSIKGKLPISIPVWNFFANAVLDALNPSVVDSWEIVPVPPLRRGGDV